MKMHFPIVVPFLAILLSHHVKCATLEDRGDNGKPPPPKPKPKPSPLFTIDRGKQTLVTILFDLIQRVVQLKGVISKH